MDPLSDVLRTVRLTGAHFYRVEAGPPWSVCTEPARRLEPRVLSDSEHLISYHILVRGSCWAGIDGEPQVLMQPGDVIVFPHGDAHLMSSHQGRQLEPGRTAEAQKHFMETVLLGPDAVRETSFVCGFLGCDARPFNPLISALPRQIHLREATTGWLSEFPQQVVAESRSPRVGGNTMLTRPAEFEDRARRTFQPGRRCVADVVSETVATAAGRRATRARLGEGGVDRGAGRLRFGGRVQSCVQGRNWRIARSLATGANGRVSRVTGRVQASFVRMLSATPVVC